MINGEGTPETPSEVVSLDDTLDDELLTCKVQGQRSLDGGNDESPVSSSRYSSCGESEIDRYCSANSVMGTPSMCGSICSFQDFHDSDFGSAKSSKLGDVGGLENFSLGGKFESNFKNKNSLDLGTSGGCSQKSESCDVMEGLEKRNNGESEQGLAVIENGLSLYDEMGTSFQDFPDEGGVILWKDGIRSEMMQSLNGKSVVKDIIGEPIEEQMLNIGVEESSESHKGIEQVNSVFEGGRYSDEHSEGETSSRLELSDSEGSMYGYGTDHENQIVMPPRVHTYDSHDKKGNEENTLLMTSSVAYGSDDWDDFMLETMENPQVSLSIDEIRGHNKNVVVSDVHTSKSTISCQSIDMSHNQEDGKNCSLNDQIDVLMYGEEEEGDIVKDAVTAKQAECISQLKIKEVSRVEEAPLMDGLRKTLECTSSKESAVNHTGYLTPGHLSLASTEDIEYNVAEIPKAHKSYSSLNINVEKREKPTPSLLNKEDHQTESKVENYELNEFYDEVVYEMEEILLDSNESPAARFTHNRKHKHDSHDSLPPRDGGSTASTSSINDTDSIVQNLYRIDNVKVIGAKQKKGDVSLGERLVGVKEYTVYKLRVWSGNHQWEVERRYRDFFTLYRRLKTSFANKGYDLPSPWSMVDRESRKFFGNASPDVVSERSVLIQECLQSIIRSRFSSSLPSSFIWFLSPQKNGLFSPAFNTHISPSQIAQIGQSISLIVEIRPHKSMGQMLEAQHYTCAGCHKYFDEGKTRIWEFVQTLGWGKPRVCEYSGQVFCSSCHLNETAILPARVLHLWDFTEYPVSQLAKSYLDSIHDKPMLCVSALNPFLFSKVPPLQHVINVRKRIGRMLPYVRCPFRRSIYKGVGSRRYILESNDFFALKDLIDLSKGVFAALPVMVETVFRRIVEHITDECLICYDVGVPCSARQACDDSSSLIFPFQEGEVERCRSCELVYHKACFKKMATCPCGVDLGQTANTSPKIDNSELNDSSNNSTQRTNSKSPMGFLSGLFSKATPANLWLPKDNDTVISMASLPSSSL